MKLTLTPAEVESLRLALFLAIENEESLMECHWNSLTQKYFDNDTVNDCRKRIDKFRKLYQKLKEDPNGTN